MLSALFISCICSYLCNPDYVRVLRCTTVVSKQSVAKSNMFPVCSSPSLIRNQSLGTWLRSSEAPMSTGLCMLVMATLFTWQHHLGSWWLLWSLTLIHDEDEDWTSLTFSLPPSIRPSINRSHVSQVDDCWDSFFIFIFCFHFSHNPIKYM